MRIAMVVYTRSGNSALVGRAAAEALRARGHEVTLDLLRPLGVLTPRARDVEFRQLPELGALDALVIGGPVWASTAAPPLKSYLTKLPSLDGKRATCFVTHGLPFRFAGATRALRAIEAGLRQRGAQVTCGEDVFCWFKPSKSRVSRAGQAIADRLQ